MRKGKTFVARSIEEFSLLIDNCPECGCGNVHQEDLWLGDRECLDGVVRKSITAIEMCCCNCGLLYLIE